MDRLIGVGIIGTGVGLRTILPGLRRTGRAEIVGLSARTQSRAEEVGGPLGIPLLTADYMKLCEDERIDFIVVSSPNDLHVEHAHAALTSGKHAYLEKPIGIDAEQGRTIGGYAVGTGRMALVGHQLRFNPYFRVMRNLIASGSIGRVYYLVISQHGSGFTNATRPWTWEFDPERGGGVRLAMGSHMVDLARYLLRGEAQSISAEMDPVHAVRTPDGGPARECKVSNFFSATLTFQGPTTVHVSTTAAAHGAPKFEVIACGENGDLTFDLSKGLYLHRVGQEPSAAVSDEVESEYRHRRPSSIFSGSFTYFADEIVDHIAKGSTRIADAATIEDGIRCLEVLDAALVSGSTGSRELIGPWSSLSAF